MAYRSLDEVTGVGKRITVRDKRTPSVYTATVVDEVSVLLDGEQKYVAQFALLDDGVCCKGDSTRHVIRIGYYTQRTDGWFCFGSQFAPMMTPRELLTLLKGIAQRGWLNDLIAENQSGPYRHGICQRRACSHPSLMCSCSIDEEVRLPRPYSARRRSMRAMLAG